MRASTASAQERLGVAVAVGEVVVGVVGVKLDAGEELCLVAVPPPHEQRRNNVIERAARLLGRVIATGPRTRP